jgi:hypothetical protein
MFRTETSSKRLEEEFSNISEAKDIFDQRDEEAVDMDEKNGKRTWL